MSEAPRRRWFQFGIGTMFVLMTILAWGLATRPYVIPVTHYSPTYHNNLHGGGPWTEGEFGQTETLFGATFFFLAEPDEEGYRGECGLNPRLLWPLIALAGFVTWQAAWRARAWRSERRRPFGRH